MPGEGVGGVEAAAHSSRSYFSGPVSEATVASTARRNATPTMAGGRPVGRGERGEEWESVPGQH